MALVYGCSEWNCLHAAYYYLEDSPPLPQTSVTDWDTRDPESTVPLGQFAAHVASLHADGDIGFSKEYEAIQAIANHHEFTTEYSQHPENKLKNRYLNILSCKI
ncbi:positive regulation of Schwann cell migration [Homalodisca vitripennis]|nr:positive regulation of Schwann cell migration [Homalodisca vitripennis]